MSLMLRKVLSLCKTAVSVGGRSLNKERAYQLTIRKSFVDVISPNFIILRNVDGHDGPRLCSLSNNFLSQPRLNRLALQRLPQLNRFFCWVCLQKPSSSIEGLLTRREAVLAFRQISLGLEVYSAR